MLKKTLSALLAVIIIFSVVPMPQQATAANAFSDFNSGSEYFAEVTQMIDKGYVNGYPDGTFKPDASVKRSEYVKLKGVGVLKRTTNFADVPRSHWAYQYIMYSSSDGFENNMFMPDANITIQEVVVLLWKDAGKPAANVSQSVRGEINAQAASWAQEAICWAFEKQIIANSGQVPNLKLTDNATRLEALVCTYRAKSLTGELRQAPKVPDLPPDPFPGAPYTIDEVVTTKERLLEIIYQTTNKFEHAVYIIISSEDIFISARDLFNNYKIQSLHGGSCDIYDDHMEAFYDFTYDSYDRCVYAYKYGDMSYLNSRNTRIYEKCLEILSQNLIIGMTDFEKARALYDYLCVNFTWETSASTIDYEPLNTNVALPQEYSFIYNLLLTLADVQCKLVYGIYIDQDYPWVLVNLDGQWYHTNPAFDSNKYIHNGKIPYNQFLRDDNTAKDYGLKWDQTIYPACPSSYVMDRI